MACNQTIQEFSCHCFFFLNLTYSRWTSSLPSCLWSLRIFPSLPRSRLTIFYRDVSSALLQLVNQWLNFIYSRSHAFRCVCVFSSHLFWTSSSLDVPAGVTQEEGQTGFLIHLSAVHALIFIARRIQPFLSLVDREVEFCVLRPDLMRDRKRRSKTKNGVFRSGIFRSEE